MAGGEAAALRDHSPSPGTVQEPPATYNLIRIMNKYQLLVLQEG